MLYDIHIYNNNFLLFPFSYDMLVFANHQDDDDDNDLTMSMLIILVINEIDPPVGRTIANECISI